MKLSEAIRLGAMMRPQAFHHLLTGGGSCAVGAALEANGIPYDESYVIQLPHDLDVAWCAILLERHACPVDNRAESVRVGDLIVHLNDDHRWTREQIAEWLSTAMPKRPATA